MRRRWQAHLGLAAAVALALAMAVLLLRYPPERYGFYPACPFHALTGFLCPGCGMTRALAALLTGRVAQAWRLNPLVFVLLPVVTGYGAAAYRRGLRGELRPWPQLPRAAIHAALAAVACFTLLRNLG
jgi:hypothetical protein